MRHPHARSLFALVVVLALGAPFVIVHGPAHGAPSAANCDRTGTGLVPLTDLGAGTYQSFAGGLYPGGENTPPARHQALALTAAAEVVPRDSAGQRDAAGRVVLLSVGMSNATQEYSAFVQAARRATGLHPALNVVDGAQGGQTAAVIRDPNANFWRVVDQRLAAAGATAAQVQAVWLKEANAQPRQAFPVHARDLTDDLTAVVGVLRSRYPQLRLVYLASRTYGGYASTALNPEPYAYESGFAVRWLIERQLAGAPGLNADPERGAVEAPVLLWGPYLWADGLTPRSDGLIWRCEDFGDDGTHPSASGRAQVAALLLGFFQSDATSRPWFLADPAAPTATATVTATAPATPSRPTATPRPRTPTASPTATEAAAPTHLWLPLCWRGRRW